MNTRIFVVFGVTVGLMIAFTPLVVSQPTSMTVTGSAGAAGLQDDVNPLYGAQVSYSHTDFGGEGRTLQLNLGVGYLAAGYVGITPIGALVFQGTAAPVPVEYKVVDDGVTHTLPMKSAQYGGSIQLMIPLDTVTFAATSAVESKNWREDETRFTAPGDQFLWTHAVQAQYRAHSNEWSENPLAPPSGWSLSGGYRNAYRPGYRPWGYDQEETVHNGAPQHTTDGTFTVGVPLNRNHMPVLLGASFLWRHAENPYTRDLPRYGAPFSADGTGVSGYAPESIPAATANVVTASVALPMGTRVLTTVRFDWLHTHDGEEEERRGVGTTINFKAGAADQIDVTAGFAIDPVAGTDLPITAAVTWTHQVAFQNRQDGINK